MTPEGRVKEQVKKLLTAHGAWWCMPFGGGYGRAGIPDFLVCVNGYFLAVECKAEDGRTTALQERELWNIQASKGAAYVVRPSTLPKLEALLCLLKAR